MATLEARKKAGPFLPKWQRAKGPAGSQISKLESDANTAESEIMSIVRDYIGIATMPIIRRSSRL